MNGVGYRKSTDLTLSSGVSSSNTNRIFRANSDGTWSSYRPDRTINGFTSLTRIRHGTDETLALGSGNVYLLDAAANFNIDEQVPIATVAEGSGSTPSENADDTTYIHTISGFDRIPNFALAVGPTTVNSNGTGGGNWTTGSTWSGGVAPAAGNIVRIRDGDTVTMNLDATTEFKVVSVENGGLLQFVTNADTKLWCQTLQIRETGLCTVGTPASPIENGVTAEIVWTDTAIDTDFDPIQYGNGLMVLGTLKTCGFDRGPCKIRLAVEPEATDTTLTLATAATNWQVGDRIAIPDTRQMTMNQQTTNQASQAAWAANAQWEVRTIASKSGDSLTLTLSSALTYDHFGARNLAGTLEYLPHVMNLSRNVIFRSENAAGTRGHGMASAKADIDIRNTVFKDMGRTTSANLNNTTFDGSGNVTNVGTNQIGRYPWHWHHCGGRAAQANGYQFTFTGNAVDGGDDVHTFKWGVTIHGTHWGLVENNALYNVFGGGIVLEDGTETQNLIKDNMMLRIPGLFGREDSDDSTSGFARNGGGIWCRSGLSRFKDNVAANCASYGFIFNAIFLGTINCPAYPSAFGGTGMVACNGYRLAIVNFDGLETYGYQPAGMTFWWLCSVAGDPSFEVPRSLIKNLVAWHYTQYGVYAYQNSLVTLEGWVLRGDATVLATGETNIGIWPGDYGSAQMHVKDCNIQNLYTCIEITPYIFDTYQITDCVCHGVEGARWNMPATPAGGAFSAINQYPRVIRIENCDFTVTTTVITGSPTKREIFANFIQTGGLINYVVQNDCYVYQRNGEAAENYRLYSEFQVGSETLTQSVADEYIGCPESGLTNTQAFAKYEPYDPEVGPSTPVKSDNPNPNTPGLCFGNAIAPDGLSAPSWTNALAETL